MDSQQRGPSLRKVSVHHWRKLRSATDINRLGAPRPTLSRVTTNDGRSPGSRVIALDGLPRDCILPSGFFVFGSPLTVAGAAAESRLRAHRIPF